MSDSSRTDAALNLASESSPGQLRRAYWAWLAVCVSWGTTFLATRIAIESLPPLAMAGTRHFVAGLVIAVVLRARRVNLPPVDSWGGHAMLGLLMIGFGNGCLVWAQQFVPSGVAAVMVSVIPFWMIGVEAFMPGGEPIRKRQVIGLVLGFGGIVLLTRSSLDGTTPTPQMLLGVVMTQLSCLGWAVGSAYAKRHKRDENLFAATAMQIVFGGAVLMAVATVTGEWPRVDPTARSLLAVLYLVLVGTFVGYVSYVYALKHLPVSIVSLYAYVNPVIAVILGSLILRERFTPRMAVAIAIIFAAMVIVRTADTSRSS
jgi:drug/metabolite transporter (DMT)-like permease